LATATIMQQYRALVERTLVTVTSVFVIEVMLYTYEGK